MPYETRFAHLATVVGIMMIAWSEIRTVEAKEGSVRAASGDPDPTEARRRLLKNNPPRVAAAAAAAGARGLATSVVLDFEGVMDLTEVGSFYDGVGGPNYGVVFGPYAYGLVDGDAGGSVNIANEPSPSTVLIFMNDSNAYMSVSAGFTGLSFQYTSRYDGAVLTVYDGPYGRGNILASVPMPRTGICDGVEFPLCGDPTGVYGRWNLLHVPFSGVAKSVRFTGPDIGTVAIDDVTILQGPPPCSQTTYWLWNPTTNAPVGELKNNSASCIALPYNIEVRPCHPPATTPVFIKLTNAALKTIKRQNEYFAPFYLWGDTTSSGDVYKNTQPLPKGTYWLYSTIDGVQETIKFTKTC